VLKALVYSRVAMGKLAGAIVALQRGEASLSKERLEAYFEADEQLNNIINEIGGVTSND